MIGARTRAFMAPTRYWQGPGEIDRIGERVRPFGESALVVLSERAALAWGDRIRAATPPLPTRLLTVPSRCTFDTIDVVAASLREYPVDLVVAIGGGTIIDTVKAAAYRMGVAVVVIPTLASTDAPTAAAAVVYDRHGAVAAIETHPAGPVAVIVDTDLIASAPLRYLVSGMGDAMATAYEASAAAEAHVQVLAGGVSTRAAAAIAGQCRATLLSSAADAIAFAEGCGGSRRAFEDVVEANILLSGLGFESGGLAAAHALHNAIKPFARKDALHGELVAYGLLVHLALLGRWHEMRDVRSFNARVGLPVSGSSLGIPSDDPEALRRIAERACDPGDSMVNMPVRVTPAMVEQAMLALCDAGVPV